MGGRRPRAPQLRPEQVLGCREGDGNFPAVPSLSVTLGGLTTRTRVRWRSDLPSDLVAINGQEMHGAQAARVLALVDRVREELSLPFRADVESRNDFPTASGLASSASGFAALALAAVSAVGDWDAARVSDLARRSSASAARSVYGGFVELDAGPEAPKVSDLLAARPVAPRAHMPLAVLVCVTTEAAKKVSSTEGMQTTMARSPYARAWLEHAPRLHAELREALLAKDFERMGELAEGSAFAMHACALAAGVTYWNAGTLAALETVRALRMGGTPAFATIDAGPHVKVLVRPENAADVRTAMQRTSGVQRVIDATVGEGAPHLARGRGAAAVRVLAPGKLVLTGAYAVLDGAPAIVAAVDRYALADDRGAAASHVDVSALHDDRGQKLGLGSSAASIVATLGLRAHGRGEDLRSAPARAGIFRAAREAHAKEQNGGSGVDIAASVFGGILRYALGRSGPLLALVAFPSTLSFSAYWSGTSARIERSA